MRCPSPELSRPRNASRICRRSVQAGEHVDEGDADLRRSAFTLPGDAHEAADRLHQQVIVGKFRAVAPAEPGDGAVHEPRVVQAQGVLVEPELLHHARADILDQHIGCRRQPPSRGQSLAGAQVALD